jgi:hypothetical protein
MINNLLDLEKVAAQSWDLSLTPEEQLEAYGAYENRNI